MKNIHPADELAMIRADLRRLKAREDYLKKGFLSLRFPVRGDEAVATVKVLKQRKLCQERLPQHILDDAEMWETKVLREVVVDTPRNLGRVMASYAPPEADPSVIETY